MTDYRVYVAEDCRRLILEALAREPSATLNETLISCELEAHWHRKPQSYVRDQIDWLSKRGAIAAREVSGIVIAQLLNKGLEHVERRELIPGVGKPKLEA